MNIYNLDKELKFINQIGQTLNVEEKMKLEMGLAEINKDKKWEDVKFWGRIEGQLKNYYFAIALTYSGKYEFPIKQFLWADDQFQFQELPELLVEYKQQVETITSPFTGNPTHMLIQVVPEGDDDNDEQQEEQNQEEQQNLDPDESIDKDAVKVVPKNFKELDRLAYIVRAIENDCQIVPQGAYQITQMHELRPNDRFDGLTGQVGLQQFQHFRAPQQNQKLEQLKREESMFEFDFLDNIVDDEPTLCWSLQEDGNITTVRSLLWQGYIGYHQLGTPVFGGCYFGNGVKNVELAFLIEPPE